MRTFPPSFLLTLARPKMGHNPPLCKNLRGSFISNLIRTRFLRKHMNGRWNFCNRKRIKKNIYFLKYYHKHQFVNNNLNVDFKVYGIYLAPCKTLRDGRYTFSAFSHQKLAYLCRFCVSGKISQKFVLMIIQGQLQTLLKGYISWGYLPHFNGIYTL